MTEADDQLGITGEKALCSPSTGISARFIWRDADSSVMGGDTGVQKAII